MELESLLWLIPVLPLVGFLINGLLGNRLSEAAVAAIGCAGPFIGFGLSLWAFREVADGGHPAHVYWTWMSSGNVDVAAGLRIDELTSVMLLVVTGVGSLIHLYSYGYMHGERGFSRFFAYLNLFMFSMLVLVMGDNLLMMFVGWEGVGLCSYLLIGFSYDDLANADAGRKAFIANRVGDFAFLLGMFTFFALAGTLDFQALDAFVHGADTSAVLATGPFAGWTITQVLLLGAAFLFVGATGKSAQIPLYVWLPDAMAGPTPVSALIHAATMVTAGIYLLGRLDFIYVLLPGLMTVIAVVAALTATLAALIAVVQNDIKKILAYSTISQLGYMFAGMASTVFVAGLFHVVTHAFFKALLFLGAGAIIHSLEGEQDIRKMGGLSKDMRGVFILFAVGALALAGVPPLAGFFSKDMILGGVHYQMAHHGGAWTLTWVLLVGTAALTAFYTTRLVILTFFGPPADAHRHPHAVHWTMMTALVVLAVLSVIGGFGLKVPLEHFTDPVWVHAISHEELHHSHHVAQIWSVVAVVLGIGMGLVLYTRGRVFVTGFVEGWGRRIHWVVDHKFFVDELYEVLFVRSIDRCAHVMWSVCDRGVIDRGLVEGAARLVGTLGTATRTTQRGIVNSATAGMLLGTLVLVGYLIWGLVTHG